MHLHELLATLEGLAPLRLAGSWDNVGLLVEGTRDVRRIGLCIDLTAPVADELRDSGVDAIVSYHPPIFGGVKRLTASTARSRTLLALIRDGIHVYSPHSALDAARDGMADWLVDAFPQARDVAPIEPDLIDPSLGAGRVFACAPTALDELVERIRGHLGLSHLRVSGAGDQQVSRVAVCPGAGGSLFERLDGVDLLLTGEMRHHDVLARQEAGVAVVLTDHTNTERGFLPIFASSLRACTGLEVVVSARDADPLRVV
ncbi:MAG: Nif3-like dinuclear metal center hexameric protein [Deltaproteobacteria bacterium]|nr:MAG: Nif3-like dinuclear metal center hexameric protein [Deltaproteobacteria bacterium]